MAGRKVPCSCGCGLVVTYATKRNHLNASGKTELRARVLTDAKSLKERQQKPTPLLQKESKKRASSNSDQDGARKRPKAAQLEENQLPEIPASSQADTDVMMDDAMDDYPPPVAADADRQSRFIERFPDAMEMRWTTSRQDGGSLYDGEGNDNDGDDDNEEDEDEEEEEEEEEEIPGISNWDLLGEGFEREAAALGLYSSYELSTQLTTL